MATTARNSMAFALACLALAACSPAERMAGRSQSAAAPKLETGIIGDTGGGQQALGNTLDVPLGRSRVR